MKEINKQIIEKWEEKRVELKGGSLGKNRDRNYCEIRKRKESGRWEKRKKVKKYGEIGKRKEKKWKIKEKESV